MSLSYLTTASFVVYILLSRLNDPRENRMPRLMPRFEWCCGLGHICRFLDFPNSHFSLPLTWTKELYRHQTLSVVYRLDIKSVMLVFSIPLVNCCLSTFSLTYPTPPPLPKVNVQYIQTVCGCGVGVVLLSCVVDHILQEFNTLFLMTRFRTYKIATPPQTKTPVKTTFRDWCL